MTLHAVGHERRPVLGLHVGDADDDEEQDRRELHRHHRRVEARALAHADDEQHGDEDDDDHRRQIESAPAAVPGAAAIHAGSVHAEPSEDPLEVAAPPDRHRHRSHRIFEDQVPTDHPREHLAERCVSVGVGAAGNRNHRRELGVAERGEAAGQSGRDVGEHDRRARPDSPLPFRSGRRCRCR